MKNLLSIYILCYTFVSFTQSVKPKCIEGNCRNKIGTYLYADSSIYTGSFNDKLKNGKGKMNYINGSYYDGDWQLDKKNGKGKMNYSDGSSYEGDWQMDNRNGKGKMYYSDGSSYEGDWSNDKRNGNGVYIDSIGNKYEGLWVDDKENGKGKYTDLKGNVYEGSWTNGALLGYITLRYKNKSLYEGEYNDGIRGKGKFTYSDGSVYTGNFAKNKRSGYGELIYSFDLTYKGNWVSNEVEGQGEFYLTSNQIKIAEGNWKTDKTNPSDSKFISSNELMICYYANKNLYYGKSQKGLPNGIGTMKYSNGDIYEGNFERGLMSGNGRFKYKDIGEYNGEWKNGLKDGSGILIKADNSILKGYWKNGEYLDSIETKYSPIIIKNIAVQTCESGVEIINDSRLTDVKYTGKCVNGLKEGEWKGIATFEIPSIDISDDIIKKHTEKATKLIRVNNYQNGILNGLQIHYYIGKGSGARVNRSNRSNEYFNLKPSAEEINNWMPGTKCITTYLNGVPSPNREEIEFDEKSNEKTFRKFINNKLFSEKVLHDGIIELNCNGDWVANEEYNLNNFLLSEIEYDTINQEGINQGNYKILNRRDYYITCDLTGVLKYEYSLGIERFYNSNGEIEEEIIHNDILPNKKYPKSLCNRSGWLYIEDFCERQGYFEEENKVFLCAKFHFLNKDKFYYNDYLYEHKDREDLWKREYTHILRGNDTIWKGSIIAHNDMFFFNIGDNSYLEDKFYYDLYPNSIYQIKNNKLNKRIDIGYVDDGERSEEVRDWINEKINSIEADKKIQIMNSNEDSIIKLIEELQVIERIGIDSYDEENRKTRQLSIHSYPNNGKSVYVQSIKDIKYFDNGCENETLRQKFINDSQSEEVFKRDRFIERHRLDREDYDLLYLIFNLGNFEIKTTEQSKITKLVFRNNMYYDTLIRNNILLSTTTVDHLGNTNYKTYYPNGKLKSISELKINKYIVTNINKLPSVGRHSAFDIINNEGIAVIYNGEIITYYENGLIQSKSNIISKPKKQVKFQNYNKETKNYFGSENLEEKTDLNNDGLFDINGEIRFYDNQNKETIFKVKNGNIFNLKNEDILKKREEYFEILIEIDEKLDLSNYNPKTNFESIMTFIECSCYPDGCNLIFKDNNGKNHEFYQSEINNYDFECPKGLRFRNKKFTIKYESDIQGNENIVSISELN
jgi:antitoxin component YwqK of YwqJK toxin-antitoxin module